MANSQHAEDNSKQVKMPGEAVVTSTPNPAISAPVIDAGVAESVPSFVAASELLSAPYSCLVMNTHRRHIALSPLHLNKKKTGIRQELDAELLKFSPSLSGVPLAYDNIVIVRPQGDIFDDSGYIHLNIEANFIVFQPKKGQTLLGKVNKLGANHVGCLVHGCFNASIPKPNRVSMETWRDAGPQIGSELEFNVTALDADTAGVLLIRGQLIRTRLQELLAIGESMASTIQSTVQQPVKPNANQTTEPMEVPPEETPKKKKKKKKDKVKEEASFTPEKDTALDTSPELNGTTNQTLDGSSGSTEKKKKKKRDKIKEAAPFTPEKDTALDTTLELNRITIETLDESSGSIEKKKKKIKIEKEEPVTTIFSPEQDTFDTTAEFNGTMDETNGYVEQKKKKKKDKHVKEEPQEVELSSVEVHGSDSTGYLSDKPSKKRKRQTESEELEMLIKKKLKTLIELKKEIE